MRFSASRMETCRTVTQTTKLLMSFWFPHERLSEKVSSGTKNAEEPTSIFFTMGLIRAQKERMPLWILQTEHLNFITDTDCFSKNYARPK
jgi:hypothetical protein